MSSGEDWLAEQFEQNRAYLREVGYRLLGSRSDAEDAVQDAWLRLSRSDTEAIRNLSAWLTTVVSRICLDRLRDRATHSEVLLGARVPELALTYDPGAPSGEWAIGEAGNRATDPLEEAMTADSVGLALIVILDTLSPAERLAFVLHDMFGLPFGQIAQLLDQSPAAARQLASRARRRVREAEPPEGGVSPAVQRSVVEAFFAAAHHGDFDALLDLLHPDAVLRADGGDQRKAASAIIRGRDAVAGRAMMFDRPGARLLPVLADGLPAVVVLTDGAPVSVMVFTVTGNIPADARIWLVDVVLDPVRLRRVEPDLLGPAGTTTEARPSQVL